MDTPHYKHKPRGYLHFDPQVSAQVAERIATDPQRVASHSFYPFLGFSINTPKISRTPAGGIEKKEKRRPIKLAAHLDAAIYAYYGQILSNLYEQKIAAEGVGDSVTAFRRLGGSGKNNIYFANEVFQFIQSNRPCSAVGLDVEKFFDTLDHRTLKGSWQRMLGNTRLPSDHFNVFKNLTDFRWVNRDSAFEALGISPHNPNPKTAQRRRLCSPQIFRNTIRANGLVWKNPEASLKRGIPQGAPISALLSNIYMLDFDVALTRAVRSVGGLYRRYCDDIMIVVPTPNAHSIEQFAMAEIQKLQLTINPTKTTRAAFPANPSHQASGGAKIQYLGFDFNGTQTLIRASSLSRYYSKMRKGVSVAKQTQRKHNKIRRKQGLPKTGLKTRQLYIRYSYLINRRFHRKDDNGERQGENFITYAHRAAARMNAPEIKRQIRNHPKKLKEAIMLGK